MTARLLCSGPRQRPLKGVWAVVRKAASVGPGCGDNLLELGYSARSWLPHHRPLRCRTLLPFLAGSLLALSDSNSFCMVRLASCGTSLSSILEPFSTNQLWTSCTHWNVGCVQTLPVEVSAHLDADNVTDAIEPLF